MTGARPTGQQGRRTRLFIQNNTPMDTRIWNWLYFIDLAAELVAINNNWSFLRFFTKPLLTALLLARFTTTSKAFIAGRNSIIAALVFSWLGDTALLLEDKAAIYFMAGLASFLFAHVAYILFFLQVRARRQKQPMNTMVVASVAAYGAALFSLLKPGLGSLQVPVLVYALALCTMAVLALHAFPRGTSKARWYCIAGASLFVISDSALAVNKFRYPFPGAGVTVMLTYALAQYALVKAALMYLAGNIQPASTSS